MKSNYKLGDLIQNVDVKNKDLHCTNLRGLSMNKEFRASTSNIVGTDLFKAILKFLFPAHIGQQFIRAHLCARKCCTYSEFPTG